MKELGIEEMFKLVYRNRAIIAEHYFYLYTFQQQVQSSQLQFQQAPFRWRRHQVGKIESARQECQGSQRLPTH